MAGKLRKNQRGAKTFETYAEFIRLYMVPTLGRHLLSKLQPAHIQGYYRQMLASGRRKTEGGLSARSVLHHHRVLREALQQAVKWQFLARNPADAVVAPKPERIEMKVLDEAQSARLLQHAEGTRLFVPILVAITTGMRRGEILGLRWSDVDLAASRVTVQQSLSITRQGLQFKAPKTAKSRRSVTLPSLITEALQAHRTAQQQTRELLGAAFQDHGLVLPEPDGMPWSPNAFSKAFRLLLTRCDLPLVRFHDLRHGHATQLLKQGVHPKIVSERLGHSTITLTLDTYSHVLPGMQEEVSPTLDASLRQAIDKAKEGEPDDRAN